MMDCDADNADITDFRLPGASGPDSVGPGLPPAHPGAVAGMPCFVMPPLLV
jgi:hypothetical protein